MPPLHLCSRLALALLAFTIACGGGSDATAPDTPPPGSSLPAELVGEWHYQQILDQSCDPDTGQCVTTADQSETVTLSSNSHFEHVFVGESNFPPCSREILHQSEGTAEVQGSTLLLHMSKGTTKVTDTCGESSTEDEAGETDTYTWALSEESGTPQLTLTNDKGTELGPFDKKQ
jgi:hypothetical protein